MSLTLQDLDIARICRELALVHHAGIRLADGVFLLAQDAQFPFKEKLQTIGKALDDGAQLSQVLRESDVFPQYMCEMVHIGERTGRLEEALGALGEFYEERHCIRRQIRNAVAYPGMVFGLMLLVIGVLLVKVIPIFGRVYASLGSQMTGVAAGLLYLGQGLEKLLPLIFSVGLVVAVGALGIRFCPSLRKGLCLCLRRYFGDRGVFRKQNNARFARGLAMGMRSGLQLEESLELAQNLLQDTPGAAQRCAKCIQAVRSGELLQDALEKAQLLPSAQSRMLALGVRSGNADAVMDTIAQTMLEDAQNDLEDTIARIEPAMVLVSSLLVGMILLAVMLPLMDVLSVLG